MTQAFNSGDVKLLSRALELAWHRLQRSGMLDGEGEAAAKGALTKGLIEAADRGVRDEATLAAHAVAQYRRWRERMQDGSGVLL
jgi:hypothetical protein